MVEIVRLQDPVERVIAYLSDYLPTTASIGIEVPARWAWDDLLVVVTDVGGNGERDVVLDDARLMVEVSHPDSVQASRACRNVHGLLRAWRDADKTVTFLRTIQRPTYSPDDETRTPAYSTIVDLIFRADRREVQEISDS